MNSVTTTNRALPAWRIAMWGTVAALLMLPLVAMRFTDEVVWTGLDFVTAAVLLGGAAALFEVAVRTIRTPRTRVLAGLAILAVLVLVWLQLAVQII